MPEPSCQRFSHDHMGLTWCPQQPGVADPELTVEESPMPESLRSPNVEPGSEAPMHDPGPIMVGPQVLHPTPWRFGEDRGDKLLPGDRRRGSLGLHMSQ